jgi:hypothetical protein
LWVPKKGSDQYLGSDKGSEKGSDQYLGSDKGSKKGSDQYLTLPD